MQKSILTILFALFSQAAVAQTSFEEPELDLSALDGDVVLLCNQKCFEHDTEIDDLTNLVSFDSILKKPVGNARISSDYGWRIHPTLKRKKLHTGVDFSVPVGTPVKAGQAGVVVYAGWMNGYGKLVVVKHNNAISTIYGHLSSFAPGLKVGTKVRRGEVIAKSGNTGRSTGPHLHYEIRVNGLAVNHHTGKALSDRVLVFDDKDVDTSSVTHLSNVQTSRQGGRIRTVIR